MFAYLNSTMRVRYLGTSPAFNGDIGFVEPMGVYEVPKDSEYKFKRTGDYEIVEEDYKKKDKKLKVDEE